MKMVLRKAKPEDAEGIATLIREGLKRKTWIYTATTTYGKKKLENLKKTLSNKDSGFRFFVAVDKETNKIIGNAVYNFPKKGRLRHRVDFGWGVHPDYEGEGIATKVLNFALEDAKKEGFKRAEAEFAVENVASYKLALKCGFKIEGTKRKAMLTDDNRLIDTYIVGKLL